MGKMILGAVIGYIIWTILWLGSDALITAVNPDLGPKEDLSAIPNTYLLIKLISSFIFSVISGYATALIAGENRQSVLILGILLLLTGLFFQISAWNQIPLWYHLPFLILLIPLAMLGGKLKRS